jgi:transcriptional regulator with XRE-family HTH domain
MDIVLSRILSLLPKHPDGRFVRGAKKEFATRIGYDSGDIVSMWIKGTSNSYLGKLYEIANVYGVSVEWLKGETDKKERPDLVKEIGPKKAELLEAVADLTEAEQALLLEHIQQIKGLRR